MHTGFLIRQALTVMDWVLGILVAFVAYLIVMALLESDEPLSAADTDEPAATTDELVFARVNERPYYDAVVRSGIFGEAGRTKTDAAPPPETPTVEVTRRRLVLLGTMVTGDEWSSATIKNETQGKTDVYLINEKVDGQVILQEVNRREVILFDPSNNRKEILRMDTEQAAATRTRQIAQRQAPRPLARRSTVEPNQIEVDKEQFIQDIAENYAEIATQLKPVPYTDESGRVTGFTSDNVSKLPFARDLGLQDGDVVQTVNGLTIDSEERVFELAKKFRNTRKFRIGILRNGRPQVITYVLKD